jgi:hypothetical protein
MIRSSPRAHSIAKNRRVSGVVPRRTHSRSPVIHQRECVALRLETQSDLLISRTPRLSLRRRSARSVVPSA